MIARQYRILHLAIRRGCVRGRPRLGSSVVPARRRRRSRRARDSSGNRTPGMPPRRPAVRVVGTMATIAAALVVPSVVVVVVVSASLPFGRDGFPSPPPLLPRSRARRRPRPARGATFVIGDDRGNDCLASCCWGGGPLRRRRRVHAIAGTDHWRGGLTTTTMQG